MMNWVKFHHCIAGKMINVIVTKPTFTMQINHSSLLGKQLKLENILLVRCNFSDTSEKISAGFKSDPIYRDI